MDRHIATRVAWTFLGKPYLWGGDDPVAGFDCSGFVIEILKSVGALPRRGDWTAAGLAERFEETKQAAGKEGALVFWASGAGKIIHVEYCLSETLSIGASGGGSATDSQADAIRQNAYIKVRPYRSRARLWGFVDPFA